MIRAFAAFVGGVFTAAVVAVTTRWRNPVPEIRKSELLYRTTDPAEVPILLPAWARDVPELAALIDEGHRRRAEFPYTDAQRKMMRP